MTIITRPPRHDTISPVLLRIDNLTTCLATPDGDVPLVSGISLELDHGHTLALVGESGCGKSLTALSILRLLPPGIRVTSGSVIFEDTNLLDLDERELCEIRGNRIAMVFQEPMTSLNPLLTVGEQIAEPLRIHRGLSRRDAAVRAVELLKRVGVPAAQRRAADYPHQFSGGMCQRVMIAMSLSCEPPLLIADEPTTALDVTIQAQILALLRELQQQTGMAIVFITHDLALVAEFADSVHVMYAGRIVERAPTVQLFSNPTHPYTRALLRSMPSLASKAVARLPVIPGEVPPPTRRPPGCAFHPRCEVKDVDKTCRSQTPSLEITESEHACACWHPQQ